MRYLIFTKDHAAVSIGDGSFLKPVPCLEGWFCEIKFKQLADDNKWDYKESDTFTPLMPEDE